MEIAVTCRRKDNEATDNAEAQRREATCVAGLVGAINIGEFFFQVFEFG